MVRRKGTDRAENVAVGYVRCSTTEQATTGASLDAQRSAIEAEATRQGWTLAEVFEDAGLSGKTMNGRVALAEALQQLDAGEASVLVVAKLDRATRSLLDAARLLERAAKNGWRLHSLDLQVDVGSPAGKLVAGVMASVAEWERATIGVRTREGLRAKQAQGVRVGRPPALPTDVVERIVRAHDHKGLGWSAIARQLEADGVPTGHGAGRWWPATVRYVYQTATRV